MSQQGGTMLGAGKTLSHYRLVEEIGAGGMGVVWKAVDTTLGRDVAIKVLPPNVAVDPVRRKMFADEAKLASRLTDAHIAQVHELGQADGTDFIVMEYVDGRPLDEHIRERSLSPQEIAGLGEQVARALARAHKQGLIHRDLKPGNILVNGEGEAKVVDFGLATLFERADETMLTRAPTVSASDAPTEVAPPQDRALMGTLPYMSPEQVRLEKLDGRSDIFSLGTVLYQMATGQLPFLAPTAAELMQEVRRARPTPARELQPEVPPELEQIIARAMAPRREDRYQGADELAADLKGLRRGIETGTLPSQVGSQVLPWWRTRTATWSAAAVLALAVVAWFLWPRIFPAADPDTVLVLPLEVQGMGEDNEFRSRWFAGVLAVNLAQRAGHLTLPLVPASVELAGGGTQAAIDLARSLGAGRVLSGTLIEEGGILRASLSLVDATANRILWGTDRTAARRDLALLPADLAVEVATELGAVERKLYDWNGAMTRNPELARSQVYLETLTAIRRWESPEKDVIEQLLADFPDEPDALVVAGGALVNRNFFDRDVEAGRRARELLADLMRLDPQDARGQFGEAWWAARDGDQEAAVEGFTRLLERDDLTLALRAEILAERALYWGGDEEAALRDHQEAVRLGSPVWWAYNNYGMFLYRRYRVAEALHQWRLAYALNPNAPGVRPNLSMVLALAGKWQEALPFWKSICESRWEDEEMPMPRQDACGAHAYILYRAGKEAEALEAAAAAEAMDDSGEGTWLLARYHALHGDRDAALDLLRRHVDLPGTGLRLTGHHHGAEDLASLRGDPEFDALEAEEWREAAAVGPQRCESEPSETVCALTAVALHLTGRDGEARAAAARAAGAEETALGSIVLAWYHAFAGNRDETIHYMTRRLELGEPLPGWHLEEHPGFDWLRGDPEFDALMVKLRGEVSEEPGEA